jgi:hypothetical protein
MLVYFFEVAQVIYWAFPCDQSLTSHVSIATGIFMTIYVVFASTAFFKLAVLVLLVYSCVYPTSTSTTCSPLQQVPVYVILVIYCTVIGVFLYLALLQLLTEKEDDPCCAKCNKPIHLRHSHRYSYFNCCRTVVHLTPCNHHPSKNRCPFCIVMCA